jgi:hypothetical protein
MKNIISVGALTLMLTKLMWAQPQPPQQVWGTTTNGIYSGVQVGRVPWREDDLYCEIDVKESITNHLYVWFPPIEHRYEMELRGPDGRLVHQLKPIPPTNTALSRGLPLSIGTPFNTWSGVDWFFLKDTFDVRTNGQFTLILFVRANAFTNFIVGQTQMRQEPTYFVLPPVTNRFNVK